MYNDLFTIGPLTVHTYGLMTGLGVIAAMCMSWRRAGKRGLNDDFVSDLAIGMLIVGYLGAKLLYVIVNWQAFLQSPKSVLGSEGFVVYGGLLFGLLSIILLCRWKKQRFFLWTDVIAPGVAAAQSLGRIGCFMAGCCYGKPTDSCLGVVFPAGSLAPAGVRLLPTQLFSSAGDLALMVFLLWLDRKPHYEGKVMVWYLGLYSVGRFCMEFLRADLRGSVGVLSTSQFISLFMAGAMVLLGMLLRRRSGAKAEDSAE